ncbi:oxidoreductase [Mycobacterium sp. 852002-51971_SCH5477799-a]|uniref:SDR family NAD(P)-dependent oxidoreductase n=1 Tax=Mycobacterium sp. 852002-51971_SCH5477799-a TaxID=1834106 RepID=UPI0008023500|nr:SDR family oxidoreductase [Mycobacterium sp. 852002-51971_SCH5477799-a]OBF60466.1 oxidoreductase [Mycobacterium sp. 852002-51971_SCH5477799-a]
MRLNDKVAIITGAGSGVGRATALRFLVEGAKVVCADVRKDWIDKTLELAGAAESSVIGVPCDVSVENDLEAVVAATVSHFGRLDIMHNNAGITGLKPGCTAEDFTDAEWQKLLQINVSGVFYGSKYAIRQFKKQGTGGVILNTGSVAGMVGFGSVLYGATKGAVNQLTKGLAIEFAAQNIRVNAICPAGMPLTNFSATDDKKFEPADQNVVDYVAQLHPLGRVITAEDCADAAVFLSSDEAKNITGVLLPIDGGYVAK